ncbi:MAG: tRNA (cytidine(34)-2'-O)-methyltransferase, partial [Desulfopila sp.]
MKSSNGLFNIVLVQPEIPPNTGSIARLCGATNCTLHLVHPLGFSTDDKHLKRAGLDYWKFVEVIHWRSLEEFLQHHNDRQLYFFTTKTTRPYTSAGFNKGDYLIFGKKQKAYLKISCNIITKDATRCRWQTPTFEASTW